MRASGSSSTVLFDRILTTGPVDSESTAWAAEKLHQWLRYGGQISMGSILGLQSSRRAIAIRTRDAWLREAARATGCGTPWDLAGRLLERIEILPLAIGDEADRLIALAMAAGARIPTTRQQLSNILGVK